MRIKPGGVRASIELEKDIVMHPSVADLGATDGIQYSSIATFGTTAVQILSERLDPGFTMKLRKLEFGLAQRFTALNAASVASIMYHWQAQSDDYVTPDGTLLSTSLIPLCATISKGIGTLLTSDDVLSGRAIVGSIPFAPLRIILTAIGIRAAACQGKISNASYVRMVGAIIPGA